MHGCESIIAPSTEQSYYLNGTAMTASIVQALVSAAGAWPLIAIFGFSVIACCCKSSSSGGGISLYSCQLHADLIIAARRYLLVPID